jgi:hypothetical protein
VTFFVSSDYFGLKSTLSDMNIATPACFGASFAWEVHPFTLFVFASEEHFLSATIGVVFLYSVHQSVASFQWRIETINIQGHR